VEYLIRSKLVKSARVAEALRAVDRGKYVNHAYASRTDAYQVRVCVSWTYVTCKHCGWVEGQTIPTPHCGKWCLMRTSCTCQHMCWSTQLHACHMSAAGPPAGLALDVCYLQDQLWVQHFCRLRMTIAHA
jgi:hypothetical protein